MVWRTGRGGDGTAAARWDAATGTWTPLPRPAEGDDGLPLLVAAADGALRGLRTTADVTRSVAVTLPPGAGSWTVGDAPAPLEDPWAADAAALDGGLVVVGPDGAGAVERLATGAWARLPGPPPLPGGAVRVLDAGGDVLLWAASPPGAAPPSPAALRWSGA